jgi:hypothetical protein
MDTLTLNGCAAELGCRVKSSTKMSGDNASMVYTFDLVDERTGERVGCAEDPSEVKARETALAIARNRRRETGWRKPKVS